MSEDLPYYQKAWQEAQHGLQGDLQLGERFWIALRDFLHCLIVGPTGMGKSKLLELLCRLIILQPFASLILIDPGGDLYRALLAWACRHGLQEKILPLDPGERPWIPGYNATAQSTLSPEYRAARKTLATLKVWGQEDSQATPRARRWLFNTFHSLITQELTLAEAAHLLDLLDNGLRDAIVKRLPPSQVKREWQVLAQMKLRERQEQLESTANRLRMFLDSPLRYVLTQQAHALDLRDVITQQKALLVNLQPFMGLTPEDTALMGTLLVDDAICEVFSRPPDARSHVFLVIDEAADFITRDIGKIMTQGRKFNLHLILACQDLEQLREDQRVYADIMANTRSLKIVFGGLPDEDLQILAKELFTEQFNLKEEKLRLMRTFFSPHESQRTVFGSSWGSGRGRSTNTGDVFGMEQGLWGVEQAEDPHTHQEASGESESEFAGGSEATVPFYEFEREQETASIQYFSLEELIHQAVAKLKALPQRCIAIKQSGERVVFDKTPEVPDTFVEPAELTSFKEQLFKANPYYGTLEEIEAEQAARLKAITQPHAPDQPHPDTGDDDDETYWQ